MKRKILNGLAVLTSLVGYLEWGGGNSSFLFQARVGSVVQICQRSGRGGASVYAVAVIGSGATADHAVSAGAEQVAYVHRDRVP